jgi:hypothetical protein
VDGWNATSRDNSRPAITSGTSMTFTTADAPFFSFMGKVKFEFFSNDTTVLGLQDPQEIRRDPKSAHKDDGQAVHLDTEQFQMPDVTLNLFNYNYNTNTGTASQSSITLMQTGPISLKCKECYLYAGEASHVLHHHRVLALLAFRLELYVETRVLYFCHYLVLFVSVLIPLSHAIRIALDNVSVLIPLSHAIRIALYGSRGLVV